MWDHALTLRILPRRFEGDPAWSETGDRYLLKLFRDYVFHQVKHVKDMVVANVYMRLFGK
jgi:hypothetical protein